MARRSPTPAKKRGLRTDREKRRRSSSPGPRRWVSP